jgi:ectoine hydroxylase-related dioxygenase (phytanoyl-CoA dioxygenase family)
MRKNKVLSDQQVQSFMNDGYLIVKNCIDPALAEPWIERGFERLGYDRRDPATWTKDITWMHHENERPIREFAPKAWEAILDVVGGEERLETQVWAAPEGLYPVNSFNWSDAFIINFHRGADKPWEPPSPQASGWHKDGGYFRHFLDSPEQGLLTIVMWSAMRHQGGGTFIAPDSVRLIARVLADHPEGIPVKAWDFEALIKQCERFEELTGEAGDFVILHPFMLHASSQNVIGVPRIMTNPPVVLKEPMNFNRADPDEFSLLERATLNYLGVERYDFKPAAPRQADWKPM